MSGLNGRSQGSPAYDVFLDTSGLLGLTLPRDQWHEATKVAWSALPRQARLVTTYDVLTEYLSHMAEVGPYYRERATQMTRFVLRDARFLVFEAPVREAFLLGLDLYERRRDKGYSLVDCISMQVMTLERITTILSGDHHFTQEGFQILIRR